MNHDITELLHEVKQGSDAAYNKLFALVYSQLKELANKQMVKEQVGHTYSQTDLVHELFIDLANKKSVDWKNRAHFFSLASICMRQLLIDYARKKFALKRGGKASKNTFIEELFSTEEQAEELISLDDALKKLEKLNKRLSDVVQYRFFGNMALEEIAEVIGVSEATVKRDWAKARGWLYHELHIKI
ncbi:MAG: sigma-70 family RNA polymerase sigma factor [Balneolaceae bacterium]|nr:MAG: sigma-70 family RNA polymerase sigma factor [Balneolaceae bacterium]